MLCLFPDSGSVGLMVYSNCGFVTELMLHIDLGAAPLATRLKNMDASALGGYTKEQVRVKYDPIAASEKSTYC